MVEADQAVAALHFPHHLSGELSVAEGDFGPSVQLLARAHQALPDLLAPVNEQQHLTGPAGAAVAQQTGGQHPAVVEHQAVPRPQQLGQVVEVHVLGFPCHLVQGQQPGGVPPLQGRLGNEFFRQIKIKIRCFHNFPTVLAIISPAYLLERTHTMLCPLPASTLGRAGGHEKNFLFFAGYGNDKLTL